MPIRLLISPFRSPFLRTLTVALAALLVVAIPSRGEAADGPERRSATLLVTAGLAGKLADDVHTVADFVATIRQLEARNRAEGRDVAVIDAGVTLVPYAESRFDGGAALSAALDHAGHRLVAPHPVDWSVGPARVMQLGDDHPFQVLRGFDTDDPWLRALPTDARLDLAGVGFQIRVFAHPNYVGALAASGIEARPLDPGGALIDADPDALQVAILHSRGDGSGIVSRQMTWDLVETPAGFDLLLDPDLEADLALRRDTADGAPVFLVGRELSTAEPWRVAELDLELIKASDGWRLDSVRQTLHGIDPEVEADPALERQIADAFSAFREAYGQRLPAAAPAERADLEVFTLGALREAAGTEIAILNQGALRPVAARYFEDTPLHQETVMRLLSYDQGIVVGSLTGADVQALVEESVTRLDDDGSPRQSSLRFAGVTFDVENAGTPEASATSILINGRPLYPTDSYSVAINAWLADGGDGYPQLAQIDDPPLTGADGDPLELREDVVLPRLDDAAVPLDDPATRGLWRFGIQELTFSFDGIEVDADEAYQGVSDSRASTDASQSVQADVQLFADQQWSRLRWENHLRIRFGLLDPRDDDDEVEELQDDVRMALTAVFLDRRWLRGNPYVGYILDSEIRADRSDGRDLPRQFEHSLTAGLEWTATYWPRIRLGALARAQDDTEEAERLGVLLEASYLRPATGGWPGVAAELRTEYAEDSEATIERFDLEISFPMTVRERLTIAPTWNFYRYRDSRLPGAADYERFSLALSWSWNDKYQR
ncbi:MAG: 5'-nucleotidase [Acidobacteriota bacterium]